MALKRLDKRRKQELAAWRVKLESDARALSLRHAVELRSAELQVRDAFGMVEQHLHATTQMNILDGDLDEAGRDAKSSLAKLDDLKARITSLRAGLVKDMGPRSASETIAAAQAEHKTTEQLLDEELAVLDGPLAGDVLEDEMPGFIAAHLRGHGGARTIALEGPARGSSDHAAGSSAVGIELASGSDDDSEAEAARDAAEVAETQASAASDGVDSDSLAAGTKLSMDVRRRFRKSRLLARDPFSLQLVATPRLAASTKRTRATKMKRWKAIVKAVPSDGRPAPGAQAPRPPTHVRAGTATEVTLPLRWQAPAFDGGAPITEYELRYRTRRRVQETLNRAVTKTSELLLTRTSRWCLALPVAFEGTELRVDEAETELIDVQVRAVNSKGPSDWSEALASAKTKPHSPPSRPLHLRQAGASPSSFTIRWEAPMHGGGRPLSKARIRFLEDVPDWSTIIASGDVRATKAVQHEVLIAWALAHTVTGLRFGSTFRAVCVQAINDRGDDSFACQPLQAVNTTDGTKVQQLEWRLAQAASSDTDPMDVLYHGFYQRMKKRHYLQILGNELDSARQEEVALAEAAEPTATQEGGRSQPLAAADRPGSDEPESTARATLLEDWVDRRDTRRVDERLTADVRRVTRMRRRHYRLKIERLQATIDERHQAITGLQARRVRLRRALGAAEVRLRALKAERKQLAAYKGRFVDSAIMHGRSHRHETAELLDTIDDELDKKMDDIALGKQVIIEGMQKEERLEASTGVLRDSIQQRLAAQHDFEKDVERRAKQAKAVSRLAAGVGARAMEQWKVFVADRNRSKLLLRRLMHSALRGLLLSGLRTWEAAAFRLKEVDKRRDDDAAAEEEHEGEKVVGRGGELLRRAKQSRELAMADLTEMLGEIQDARTRTDLASRTRAQRERMFEAAGSDMASANGDAPALVAELERAHLRARVEVSRRNAKLAFASAKSSASPELAAEAAAAESAADLAVRQAQEVEGSAFGDDVGENALASDHSLSAAAVLAAVDPRLGEQIEMLVRQGEAMAGGLPGGGVEAVLAGFRPPDGLGGTFAVSRSAALTADAERAVAVLRRAEFGLRAHGAAAPLARVYRALTSVYSSQGRHDLALVHVQRWHSAASEAGLRSSLLDALEAWGVILRKWGHHSDALKRLERVLQDREVAGDEAGMVRVMRELADLYLVTGRKDQHELLSQRGDAMSTAQAKRVASGVKALQALESRLSGAALKETSSIRLEAVSPMVPALRVQRMVLERTVGTLQKLLRASEEFRSERGARRKVLTGRLGQAQQSGGTMLDVSRLDAQARREAREAARSPSEAGGSSRPGTAMSQRSGPRPPSASGLRGQSVEREQLMERLRTELLSIDGDLAEADATIRRLTVRIENCEDDLAGIREHMGAETNSLVERVYGAAPLRCVAFNQGNYVSNDVLGRSSGGVGKLATAVDRVVMAHTLDGGLCTNGYSGDSADTAIGPGMGHTSRVVSIAFAGRLIVTGSTDTTVRVWDVDVQPMGKASGAMSDAAVAASETAGLKADESEAVSRALRLAGGPSTGIPPSALPRMPRTHKHAAFADDFRAAGCMLLLEGHSGAVWSVAVNSAVIVTGGADQRVMVWRRTDGKLLRKLRGHGATVRSISLEEHAFVSGSVEGELRMWDYEPEGRNPAAVVRLRRRLIGHEGASVTVTGMLGDEVVSGASDGQVLVWNVDTGEPTRRFELHRGAVTALQFDAIKIVTAGADLCVRVTDIISGRPLQEFPAAHDSPVVALQFDLSNLVTASVDRVMKVWEWEDAATKATEKQHVLKPGEPIARVAKTYGVSIQDIMKWNNVSRLTGFYQGQRIIVAAPSALTGLGAGGAGTLESKRNELGDQIGELRAAVDRGVVKDHSIGGGVRRLLAKASGRA